MYNLANPIVTSVNSMVSGYIMPFLPGSMIQACRSRKFSANFRGNFLTKIKLNNIFEVKKCSELNLYLFSPTRYSSNFPNVPWCHLVREARGETGLTQVLLDRFHLDYIILENHKI